MRCGAGCHPDRNGRSNGRARHGHFNARAHSDSNSGANDKPRRNPDDRADG
jgi:hypothetical protein